VFQLVDEGYDSEDISFPEEIFPAHGCALINFSITELFIAKTNTPET
jgi:hypothetical protein